METTATATTATTTTAKGLTMQTYNVTLSGGRVLEDLPHVNPDEEYGKLYLIGTSCGFSAFYALVIADSCANAVDEFVESEHGAGLRISEDDMDDYIEVTIDGEKMDVTDARRRFPDRDIDAIIRDGWEDGETTDERCNFTGQGVAYDSDHVLIIGPEDIVSSLSTTEGISL